jgi:hypothetical protein
MTSLWLSFSNFSVARVGGVFTGLDLGYDCGFRVLGLGVAELFEELCGEALFLFYLGLWG